MNSIRNERKRSQLCGIFIIVVSSMNIGLVNGRCDPNCQRGIDQAMDQANDHHTKLTQITDKLQTQLLKLDNEEIGVMGELNVVTGRVARLESHLHGNVSFLQDEINLLWRDISDTNKKIADLDKRVTSYHGSGGSVTTRRPSTSRPIQNPPNNDYTNLVKRIDKMEYNLTSDNAVWRSNFRKLNATFARLRNCNCR